MAEQTSDEPTKPVAGLDVSAKEFTPSAGDFGADSSYLRGGYFSQELGWWVPYYVGQLKSFNMRTGYGFVSCATTHIIHKTDIYIHKNQVPIPWKIGAFVEFAVSQNTRGQPQATDVYWLPLSPSLLEDPKTEGTAPTTSGSSAPSRKLHMGTLKSFSKMQGYGFISCEDLSEMQHTSDVYLDRSQIPGRWQLGQAMEFEVSYNHRGQAQARNVNWDPVPKIPEAIPAPGVTMPLPVGMPLPGGMSLPGMMGGNRTEGQQGIRNLSKILGHLDRRDVASAVKLSIELQETSDVVDYITYVLNHLGPPETGVSELTGNTPMLLLMAIAKVLRRNPFPSERVAGHLLWCDSLIPLLSKATVDSSSTDVSFANVLNAAQEDLLKARATSPDAQAFDAVIAKLGEAAKGGG